MADALARLLAIEEIRSLKARYFRLMDTKNWEEFPALFAPDATFDARGALEENPVPGDDPPVAGREAITAFISNGVGPLTTVHHGHTPEIELLSDDEARGIWPFVDVLRPGEGGPFKLFTGYGHYHETYRRIDNRWHIQSVRITRLMVRTE